MPARTTFTCPLTTEQADKLQRLLEEEGWSRAQKPHTLYAATKDKTSVAIYQKGPKVLVQGKGTDDFVTFLLEPRILDQALVGYEEVHHPEMFQPHIGIDESGKGDFFGPLVIAAVYTDASITRTLMQAGVMDSKRITSDARIRSLAETIRAAVGRGSAVVSISPAKYNELLARFQNLNRLLAWGHATALEEVLHHIPDCPRAVSDQFADPRLLKSALKERGRAIELVSRTKAESDVAVAAASILAREGLINWLRKASERTGVTLPRGASGQVKEIARRMVEEQGPAALRDLAKTHFRTAHEVAPDFFPTTLQKPSLLNPEMKSPP
ncbi:MAG: ribonuclease HIII [Verrucomicrobiia bacterium]